jgi:hypothetical protein
VGGADVTVTLDEASSVEEQPAELLFKEARQRRRRRWVSGISIAVIGMLLGSMLAYGLPFTSGPTSHPLPSGTQPPFGTAGRTGATLAYAYGSNSSGELRILSADSGASRTLPLPAPYGGSSDLAMVTVGTSLVLSRGDHAWLYRAGFHGPPIDLGPSLRVLPGPTSDEMWIWSDRCGEGLGCQYPDTGPSNGVVQSFDGSGRSIGSPIALPVDAHWFPTGQIVDSGIILEVAYGPGPGGAEVWNPILGHVVRSLPAGAVTARGNVVASQTGSACAPRCTIQVMDVQTGGDRSVRLPAGVSPIGPGSISPDGSTLALAVQRAAPGSHPIDQVVVVNVASGSARVLSGGDLGTNPTDAAPNITWSSTGMLFAAGVASTRILIWRPGANHAVALPSARLPLVRFDPPQFQMEYPSMIAL